MAPMTRGYDASSCLCSSSLAHSAVYGFELKIVAHLEELQDFQHLSLLSILGVLHFCHFIWLYSLKLGFTLNLLFVRWFVIQV